MGSGREEAVRVQPEDERIYQTLVEMAREGIGFVEIEDGVIRYCNGAYARILGLSPADLVGRSFFDFLDEEQTEKVLHEREARLRGADSAYEITVTAADGSEKRLSATGSPVFANDGSCEGAVHTILDVTERSRAEESLRESEERFRITFDRASVGMAHVAPDGRWLRINAKLCELSGYPMEELLGMSFQELTPPDELDDSLDRVRRMLDGRLGPYSVERRYIRKDGRRVWVYLSVSLIRKTSGEPHYLICVAEDITSRKLMELVPDTLTNREMEVLRCVVEGLTNPQIARRLAHSPSTVKLEVQHILAKLGIQNRRQAAVRAVEIGLVTPQLH